MILFIGTSFCQQLPAEQSLFYHFCQVEAFNFVRCDKISNFCSIRRTFFKKALAFSSEKCYLVSNKSGSRIQRLRRALHLPALGFILLIIMLFSSFTFLSFTLSRKGRKKRLPNLHGEALFSVLRFLFKDRPASIQPLRHCFAMPPPLVGEALAVPAEFPVSPESPLLGKTLSGRREMSRIWQRVDDCRVAARRRGCTKTRAYQKSTV